MENHPTVQRNEALLADVEPAVVWRHFGELAARPRPSLGEEAVRTYIIGWSEDHGLKCYRDDVGNLVVRVPGRGAGAEAEPVIIQGHLDMVTEKNSGTDHNFDEDPIALLRDGDLITADGTTLGADNGIGVAIALAAGEGHFSDHPPLELLLTVDEETGMGGARGLDPRFLSGKRLINLDAEEEGILYVGCAGGVDAVVGGRIKRRPAQAGEVCVRIGLTGLRGGHSGLDIHRNRGNAIRLLTRTLLRLQRDGARFGLVEFNGGSKRNAIPREASATLLIRGEMATRVPGMLQAYMGELKTLHADSEGDWSLSFEVVSEGQFEAIDDDATRRLLGFLYTAPNGVLTMSATIPGLVETSCNLGVVTTEADRVTVTLCARSSNAAALAMVPDQIAAQAHLAGWVSRSQAPYPGWQPDLSSGMLQTTTEVFEATVGRKPHVTAIHAGLECGLLQEKLPGCDMISFGPDIHNAHSPDESVSIRSVAAITELVGALLARLCEA